MELNFKPRIEFKCLNCSKGESKHLSTTKACPIGAGSYPQFSKTHVFKPSLKMTTASIREINEFNKKEQKALEYERAEQAEKSIVRSMDFEELVTATVELLTELTGLGIIVERRHRNEESADIHLTTLGGKIRLGYTSVSRYTNGRYGVGGTSAGCFMSNHSDDCIANVVRELFKDLEDRANKPKSSPNETK